jgi:hypothetical protein
MRLSTRARTLGLRGLSGVSRGLIIAIVIASCGKAADKDTGIVTPKPTPTSPDPKRPDTSRLAHMPSQHRGNDTGACDRTPRRPGSARSDLQGCKSDAECKDGNNGRCNTRGGGHALEMNTCEYDACFGDSDCAKGGVCMCEGTGNYCLPSTCRHDSDCGDGGACSPIPGCRGIEGYACHTSKDECTNDDECTQGNTYRTCRYQGELGHWACAAMQCPVG